MLALTSRDAVNLSAGSVVRFRHRLWRVDQANDGVFTATPLDGMHDPTKLTHGLLHREGVDGSSPSEGSCEGPANAGLSLPRPA
jgi:hypothetical protein